MKVIFAGTPGFSVPPLQALLDSHHQVIAVLTQPDRAAGRGRKTLPGPVKQLALAAGLPVLQPVSLRDASVRAQLAALAPDLMVVVAYGLLLPAEVLVLPRLGCINIHASLLPRWRGAAPIQRAILAGDTSTGVCLMQMEEGLDTGPVLAFRECPIQPDDTGSSLHDRLAALGAHLLADSLDALAAGELQPVAQDDRYATYAGKLSKAEARIDWTDAARVIERQVRAFNAWPVAETRLQGRQLRLWAADAVDEKSSAPAGTVIASGPAGIDVACGSGVLRIRELQLPGGRRLSAPDFLNAHRVDRVRLGAD